MYLKGILWKLHLSSLYTYLISFSYIMLNFQRIQDRWDIKANEMIWHFYAFSVL